MTKNDRNIVGQSIRDRDLVTLYQGESLSTRQKVELIEEELKTYPQLDLPLVHYFSEGVYGRELRIPAGTLLTGKIHKYSQLNVLLKGRILVLVGDQVEDLTAPQVIVSPPGTKRVAYAVEDCAWLTVHGTSLTDLGEIEDHFIARDDAEYLEFESRRALR